MSKLQSLKVFVTQRLTATVEEILGHLEKTIAEYEEEMNRGYYRQMWDVAVSTSEEKQRGWLSFTHCLLFHVVNSFSWEFFI